MVSVGQLYVGATRTGFLAMHLVRSRIVPRFPEVSMGTFQGAATQGALRPAFGSRELLWSDL